MKFIATLIVLGAATFGAYMYTQGLQLSLSSARETGDSLHQVSEEELLQLQQMATLHVTLEEGDEPLTFTIAGVGSVGMTFFTDLAEKTLDGPLPRVELSVPGSTKRRVNDAAITSIQAIGFKVTDKVVGPDTPDITP